MNRRSLWWGLCAGGLFVTGCQSSTTAPQLPASPAEATATSTEPAPVAADEAPWMSTTADSTVAPAASDNAESASSVPALAPGNLRPLDLTTKVGYRAKDFDGSKTFPWPAVPRGLQEWAGVPVEIVGAIFLWGAANTERGMVYPEAVPQIPVSRTFETLYVTHAAFFEGPAAEPIFHVVFRYADGEAPAAPILCGDDALDWFMPPPGDQPVQPTAERSTLAWFGEGTANGRPQHVRFCLTAVENPHPEREVESIDLVSEKRKSAGCIVALTTGDRGRLVPLGTVKE